MNPPLNSDRTRNQPAEVLDSSMKLASPASNKLKLSKDILQQHRAHGPALHPMLKFQPSARPVAKIEEQHAVVAVSSQKLSSQITMKRRTLNRAMHRKDNLNEQHSAGNTIAQNEAVKELVS